jgi:hypothetical protein
MKGGDCESARGHRHAERLRHGEDRQPRVRADHPDDRATARQGPIRYRGCLVVYANDAHLPQDFELWVWDDHAMAGTRGAEIILELAAAEGDFVLPKRTYASFQETGLDPLLRQFGVDTLILTGQQRTSASATRRPTPPSDTLLVVMRFSPATIDSVRISRSRTDSLSSWTKPPLTAEYEASL